MFKYRRREQRCIGDLSFFLHERGSESFQERAYSFDSNMKDEVSEGFKVNAFRAGTMSRMFASFSFTIAARTQCPAQNRVVHSFNTKRRHDLVPRNEFGVLNKSLTGPKRIY